MSQAEVELGGRDELRGEVGELGGEVVELRGEVVLRLDPDLQLHHRPPTAHLTRQICDLLQNIQKRPSSPPRIVLLQMKFNAWIELNLHRMVPPAVFFLFSFLSRDLLEVEFW